MVAYRKEEVTVPDQQLIAPQEQEQKGVPVV